MTAETFHCGVAAAPRRRALGQQEHVLLGSGPKADFDADVKSFGLTIGGRIPDALWDLLSIAAYVGAADQLIRRGDAHSPVVGSPWRRAFRFRLEVRAIERWRRPEVSDALKRALSFVSDDDYEFDFVRVRGRQPLQPTFAGSPFPAGSHIERVLAFSGGLDSLAGLVSSVLAERLVTAAVTVRGPTKLVPGQNALISEVRSLAAARGIVGDRVHHFPFRYMKHCKDVERTQRTRSFMVIAAAATAAHVAGLDRVELYENGVVSINLPLTEELIGARASRTTHPQTLRLFGELLALLTDRPFTVANPFLWSTKGEALDVLSHAGVAHLIGHSISCGNVSGMTASAPHCGDCSQCLDRRVAVLARGFDQHDSADRYRTDVVTAAREADQAVLFEGYYRRAKAVLSLSPHELITRYPEAVRVLRAVDGAVDATAQHVVDLHKRHGLEVRSALKRVLQLHGDRVLDGEVEAGSLLSFAVGPRPAVPGPAASSSMKPEPGRPIRVLHISDTHFAEGVWDQEHVLVALARDVAQVVASGIQPDLIVWSGDVTWSGRPAEYQRAERWLVSELLPAAGLPPSRVAICPGNHDVLRESVPHSAKLLRADLLHKASQTAVARTYNEEGRHVFGGLDAFIEFARKLDPSRAAAVEPWSARTHVIRDRRVHVAAACSVSFSHGNGEEQDLIVGRFQITQLLPASLDVDLAVYAMHHPWADIAAFDATECEEEVRRRCQLHLYGHRHHRNIELVQRPTSTTIEIPLFVGTGAA